MKNAIIVCTHNLVPEKIFKRSLDLVFKQVECLPDTEVIIVSHYPVLDEYSLCKADGFKEKKRYLLEDCIIKAPFVVKSEVKIPIVNLVIGPAEFSIETIYKQMLLAAHSTNANYICIAEHDVFYPENYFKICFGSLSNGIPLCYWKRASLLSVNGFFNIQDIITLSRFGFDKNLFVRLYEKKLANEKCLFEPVLGSADHKDLIDEVVKDYCFIYSNDVLDIKHGANATGQIIVDDFYFSHPYWGDFDKISGLFDNKYLNSVSKNPSIGYGLFYA